MWRPIVRAAATAGAVVAIAVIVATAPAEPPATPPATTTEYAPVWVLEDDGGWLCTPTGSPECDCALPPSGLGPQPAVVNPPWTCGALAGAERWTPTQPEEDDE